jgi:hypothetical protein
MEKLNLDFSTGSKVVDSICWIMSYLSWLLLVASGWASIKWLDNEPGNDDEGYPKGGYTIWTIFAARDLIYDKKDPKFDPTDQYFFYPFQMHVSLIYIVFILALIVILGGCIVFFMKTIFNKDDQVKNGMMGNFSKFHFFPLLCASALFIIGECVDEYKHKPEDFHEKYQDHLKAMRISGLVFSLIGLASLIFIYIMTDLNTQEWWVLLLLKKGTFSCLIVLMWYYFCYDIFWVRYFDVFTDGNADDMIKVWDKWAKGCSLAFSIIFGVGSLAFSYVFKDLVVSGMTALIYIGLTVYYFKIPNEIRKEDILYKNGIGAVDIIFLVLSVVLLAFLLIQSREECLKS